MPSIRYQGREISVSADESVLDALLRDGVAVPHSCCSGVCQSCMMRAVEGQPPSSAQKGLRDSRVAQGYFLPCVARLTSDLTLDNGDDRWTAAVISSTAEMAPGIVRVRIATASEFPFRPGQYTSLQRADGVTRSYSIASLPSDGFIELHVRLIPGGQMSEWFSKGDAVGHPVRLSEPGGDCYYRAGEPSRPLLLAGTGTGLAPLYGIVREAIESHHFGPIHLLHGNMQSSGLYAHRQLQDWSSTHESLRYQGVVIEGPADEPVHVGRIEDVVKQRLPNLEGFRVYLCGNPDFVRLMQKKVFLAGAAMKSIHADAFVSSR